MNEFLTYKRENSNVPWKRHELFSVLQSSGLTKNRGLRKKRKQHTNVAITLCTKKGSCYGSLTLFSHCDEMKDWPKQGAKHAYIGE